MKKLPAMDRIAKDFADHDVVFYVLYTKEPHAGQKMGSYDFSEKKQTGTSEERVEYAEDMINSYSQHRPVLIDTFGDDCVQKTLGGGRPNSLVVVDRDGKLALWQDWSKAETLRAKLVEMTGYEPPPSEENAAEAPAE